MRRARKCRREAALIGHVFDDHAGRHQIKRPRGRIMFQRSLKPLVDEFVSVNIFIRVNSDEHPAAIGQLSRQGEIVWERGVSTADVEPNGIRPNQPLE
jgi:hypothetical protein